MTVFVLAAQTFASTGVAFADEVSDAQPSQVVPVPAAPVSSDPAPADPALAAPSSSDPVVSTDPSISPVASPVASDSDATASSPGFSTLANAPVEIASVADLQKIVDAPAGTFILTGDIDATGYTALSATVFTGSLNGDGHRIYGLDNATALFSQFSGATIENLRVDLPSRVEGAHSVLAETVVNTTLDGLTLSSPLLTISQPASASLSGALFKTVQQSRVLNVRYDIPTVRFVGEIRQTGIFAYELLDTQVQGATFGSVRVEGDASSYENGLFTVTSSGSSFSDVTGDITVAGFPLLYDYGVLSGVVTGPLEAVRVDLKLTLDGVAKTYGVAPIAGDTKAGNPVITVRDSSLELYSASPGIDLQRTTAVAGAALEADVYDSTILYTVVGAKQLQNTSGIANTVGSIQNTNVTVNVDADKVYIWSGVADRIKNSVDSTYTVTAKTNQAWFTGSAIAQTIDNLSGGTIVTDLDSTVSAGNDLNYMYGVSQYTNKVSNTNIQTKVHGRPAVGVTNANVAFVTGLFGAGGSSSGDLDHVTAVADLDVNFPSVTNAPGIQVIGGTIGRILDSDITVTGKVALDSAMLMYGVDTLGIVDRTTFNYDMDVQNKTSMFMLAPFNTVNSLRNSKVNLKQSVKAPSVSFTRGIANTLKNSENNVYNIDLNINGVDITDTQLAASALEGSFRNDILNIDVNSVGLTQDRVHVFGNLGATASLFGSEVNLKGAVRGESQNWNYSFMNGMSPTAEFAKMKIYKDLVTDPQAAGIRVTSDLMRSLSGADRTIHELAYRTKQAPLGIDIGPSSANLNLTDTYFIFSEKGDYDFKALPSNINLLRSYVRYMDDNSGYLLGAAVTPVADTLDIASYPVSAYDSGWWNNHTTSNIDSPRLVFQTYLEPRFTPTGSFKDGVVTLKWDRGAETGSFVAWEEGVSSSVQTITTGSTADFAVPAGSDTVHRYRVARVTDWGIAVPQQMYVYDPKVVVVPQDPTPVDPTPAPVDPTPVPVDPTPVSPVPVDPTPVPVTPAPGPSPAPTPTETPSPPVSVWEPALSPAPPVTPSPAPAPTPTPQPAPVPSSPVVPPAPYTDIRPGSFYEPAVAALAASGVVKGAPDGTFSPDKEITRVEFAIMLKRAVGYTDQQGYRGGFNDLKKQAWYMGELAEALNTGVTKGFTDHTYRPNALIPREQAAIMLSNILRHYDLADVSDRADFADAGTIIAWAKDDLLLANAKGIIEGYPDHTVRPKGHLTRGEAAVLIYRLLSLIDGETK